MNDIQYIVGDIYTTFVPNTKHGENVYRDMVDQNGDASVLNNHAKDVIKQIRDAGYSVAKSPKITNNEMNKIFKEMEEMGL